MLKTLLYSYRYRMANDNARGRTAPESVRLHEWVDHAGLYIVLSAPTPIDLDDDEEYRHAATAHPGVEPMRR